MIKEALDSYAAQLQRGWAHDRSQTVGASEIGQCIRKTYLVKMEGDPKYGVARDPEYVDDWGAKLRGTMMENYLWAPAMKAKWGDQLIYAGSEQVSFVSGFLSATPDGMLIGLAADALRHLGVPEIPLDTNRFGGTAMAECKTSDPRSNLDEAKPANVFQTHVQMGIVREATVYKPTHSVLSYTDASFWSQVKEFVIPFDPQIYAVAKHRAKQIMTAKGMDELEPEGYFAGGSDCDYCPFTRACGIERRRVPGDSDKPIDPQLVAEFADMASEIAVLEKRVDSDSVELRKKQQALKDRMREKGIRKVPGVATWSSIKGRKSYDNKKIQAAAIAAGINIEQFQTVGDPTDRLKIAGAAA